MISHVFSYQKGEYYTCKNIFFAEFWFITYPKFDNRHVHWDKTTTNAAQLCSPKAIFWIIKHH